MILLHSRLSHVMSAEKDQIKDRMARSESDHDEEEEEEEDISPPPPAVIEKLARHLLLHNGLELRQHQSAQYLADLQALPDILSSAVSKQ